MGNLLRLLAIGDDSCCGMPENLDVFVDFENAQVKEKFSSKIRDCILFKYPSYHLKLIPY